MEISEGLWFLDSAQYYWRESVMHYLDTGHPEIWIYWSCLKSFLVWLCSNVSLMWCQVVPWVFLQNLMGKGFPSQMGHTFLSGPDYLIIKNLNDLCKSYFHLISRLFEVAQVHPPSYLYEMASISVTPFLYLSVSDSLFISLFKSTLVGLTALFSNICNDVLCYWLQTNILSEILFFHISLFPTLWKIYYWRYWVLFL